MMLRPWHLLLVLAALVVPLQAGALGGGGGNGLAVDAALDYCGVGEEGISCKIDVRWSGVENADRYTAAVTLADGSVNDMGTVGSGPAGGSTSFWVPYAGNGVYSVTITAWGTDTDGKDEKLDSKDAETKPPEAPKQTGKQKQDGAKSTGSDEGSGDAPASDGGPSDGGSGQAPGKPQDEQPTEPQPAPSPDPAPEPAPKPAPEPAPKPQPDPAPETDPTPSTGSTDSTGSTGAGTASPVSPQSGGADGQSGSGPSATTGAAEAGGYGQTAG